MWQAPGRRIEMAHVMKTTMGAIGGLGRHYERYRDENNEYVKFSNHEIDIERTHLNYNLAPARSGQVKFVHDCAEHFHAHKRADVNVMVSWVVTLPKEITGEEYQKKFFTAAYDFLRQRYGIGEGHEENIISAYVHLDETSPHMHFAFVPVYHDKEKETVKVNCSKVINRFDLQTFHGDLSKHMERVFGRDVGILNGATVEGNKTKAEMELEEITRKLEIARNQLSRIQKQGQEAAKERNELLNEVQSLKSAKNRLEGEIEALRGKRAELRYDHVTQKDFDDYLNKLWFNAYGEEFKEFKDWSEYRQNREFRGFVDSGIIAAQQHDYGRCEKNWNRIKNLYGQGLHEFGSVRERNPLWPTIERWKKAKKMLFDTKPPTRLFETLRETVCAELGMTPKPVLQTPSRHQR
jgi:hypothetical protein